ncbi:ABC transporter permease [Acetobacterium carbinolicum]|uniref:ABC transporter permease n=1 Tax=Acetobacterium carbinolicum TaxID=52690 RepID=UPI0039C9B4D0
MFRNNNKEIVKSLAANGLKKNRNRNMVMVIAIFLATVLISFVLTAGFSFFTTMYESSQATPGPGADGALIGTRETYDKALANSQVEWADFVSKCSTTSLHNDDFAGIQTELLAPDESFYTHNYIALIQGVFPKTKTQILISDTLAQKIGIKELGTEIALQVVVLQNNEEQEQEIPFEVCGIYKNPLANISGSYEEIYTVPDFIETYNPEMPKNNNAIYVKLNNLNPFLLKSDVYGKLSELGEVTHADAIQTKNYSTFAYSLVMALPLLLFIVLIMMSGYFLIHNVFAISVTSDVRWFGMMKTIGTTKKQLKAIYMRQVRILALIGISFGALAGYVVGLLLAPEIIHMTDYYLYYKAPNLWLVLLLAILFSWLTVWISCSRTLRTAASFSSIEAARYTPRHKNKAFTVISFALSGIVFLTVCNVSFGFQVENMVDRYNQNDSRIYHTANFWTLDEPYNPITEELNTEIEKLSFVERTDVIYRAKTRPDLIEGLSQRMYESFLAEVKLDGKLKQEIEAIAEVQGKAGIVQRLPNGNIKLEISGLPAQRLEQEAKYLKILDGEINIEKFESGDYILYQDIDYLNITDQEVDTDTKIHAGDVMELSFYEDSTDTYHIKEVTVMAVIEKDDRYGTGDISYNNIVLSDTLFQSIYPNYNERIASIQIVSKAGLNQQQIEAITNLVKKEHNTQIRMDSRYEDRNYYTHQKTSIMILGFFLALILGIIGISNMVNTLITDTLARKKEVLIFQAVGMTRKQLWKALFKKNLFLCFSSAIIVLVAGCYITVAVASASMFTGFNKMLFGVSFFLLMAFMVVLCAVLATIMTRQLNKKSVVERLREIE